MLSTGFRWKRQVAVALGLLAAYTAIGFWLVPIVIEHQVPRFGQSLARQASVDEVSFNPYTLRLVAAGVRLAEADGTALFNVGRIDAELQWRSILRWAWSFAEIRVTAPSANLVISQHGSFNLAELASTLR
jgi:hypothetical protein